MCSARPCAGNEVEVVQMASITRSVGILNLHSYCWNPARSLFVAYWLVYALLSFFLEFSLACFLRWFWLLMRRWIAVFCTILDLSLLWWHASTRPAWSRGSWRPLGPRTARRCPEIGASSCRSAIVSLPWASCWSCWGRQDPSRCYEMWERALCGAQSSSASQSFDHWRLEPAKFPDSILSAMRCRVETPGPGNATCRPPICFGGTWQAAWGGVGTRRRWCPDRQFLPRKGTILVGCLWGQTYLPASTWGPRWPTFLAP